MKNAATIYASPSTRPSSTLRYCTQSSPSLLLTLKRQARPDLMTGLVQLLRVKRETQPNRRASIQLGAVRKSRNTPIVDLDLGEAERIELVLARELQSTRFRSLHIVSCLRADLHGTVHFLVVAASDDAQILHARETGAVGWGLVAEAEGVLRDSRFLDVVACFAADEESFMAGCHVDDGVDVAARLRIVDEGAGVEVRVLEREVQLLRRRRGLGRVPQILKVDLGARCDDVGELDFAVEKGGGGPGLRDSDACRVAKCQRDFLLRAFAIGDAKDGEVEIGSKG